MRKHLKYSLSIVMALSSLLSYAQQTDSLYAALKTAKENIAKANTLNQLSQETKRASIDTSVYFSKQALALSEKLNYPKGIADAQLNYGIAIMSYGRYSEALQEMHKALEYYNEELKYKTNFSEVKQQLARAYNNIGITFDLQGNYPEAVQSHLSALKIREELGDKKGIASSHNNLGVVYYYQKNYALALKHNLIALKIKEETGDRYGLGNCYMNIGNVYLGEGNSEKALENYTLSAKIWEEVGNMQGVAAVYNNIGEIYRKKGDYENAQKNHFASLKIKEETKDQEGVSSSLVNIGIVYLNQKKTAEAKIYFEKALELSKKIGNKNIIVECYAGLALVDSTRGDMKHAFENYKMNILYRDSLINEENSRKILQTSMEYDHQKKAAVLKEQQEKERIISEEKSRFQQIVIWSAIIGLLLVLVFVGFVIRTLKATRSQKLIIEEKQREILDSIRYAKRIQKSMLPTEVYIGKNLSRLNSR